MNPPPLPLLAALLAARPAAAAPPPSLVLIVVDALRADRLTPYGAPRPTTPSLARLAARGTLFRAAWAQANWTLPSLASIMTGLYPSAHGAWSLPSGEGWPRALERGAFSPRPGGRLDESRTTLAELLSAAGYRAAGVVSGGICRSEFGFAQGFSEYHDLGSRLSEIAPRVLEAARREPGRPFFLYLHLNDAHDPQTAPPEALRRWDRAPGEPGPADFSRLLARYDASVAEMDARLGPLLEELERAAEGRLLVAVTSDHGEAFGERGRAGHGRGGHEELLRVPLILAGPGVPAGRVDEGPAELVDLLPTFLEAAGQPPPSPVHGRSLLPRLRGGPAAPKAAFAEVREADGGRTLALRGPRYKVLVPEGGAPRLFDLAADPGERRDLAGAEPGLAARLAARARALRARALGDARPLPAPGLRGAPLPPAAESRLRAAGYLR